MHGTKRSGEEYMAAKKIMVQGTMSNSGKSFLTAALCRIFRQDGFSAAPFKSQNMALNSFITKDGLEIGRAQAMQAESAGICPTVDMNPILLKPTSQMGSQVIVNGQVAGNWKAMDYYRRKPEFIPVVRAAFERLERQFDIIVLEGAGSPAEINLRDHDLVNMGMAKMANAPVLLVGDIDRGGVFASLYGTVKLLDPEEQAMIKGLVINKFRGDVKLLEPGLRMIEERLNIPVVGVIPMEDIDLDDEDSLSGRFACTESARVEPGKASVIDIAVVRFPHISNFTDFQALERKEGVNLRYVAKPWVLGKPDLVILPGTKNTMADLAWMRENGLEKAVFRLIEGKTPVIGICGGYQMMGEWLQDPAGAEGIPGRNMQGMGLLPAKTVFSPKKTCTQTGGKLSEKSRMFAGYGGEKLFGYEIHMGKTFLVDGWQEEAGDIWPAVFLEDGRMDGMERADGLVFGSYLHGLFDNDEVTKSLLGYLAGQKGISWKNRQEKESVAEYKERQYNKLADLVRKSLDMERIYEIVHVGV